jgi:choline dehydrogenase-like flavoprotein
VPADYDDRARAAGDTRWNWHNVLPYFLPAEGNGRGDLKVLTHALCERVLLDHDRAIGVQLRRRGGQAERVEAGDVILAGGTINSPQLLVLSGIGPADHLREYGIAVTRDLPGVGANVSDHLDICTLVHCTRPVTCDHPHDSLLALQFLLRRRGAGTSNLAEAGGFVRSGSRIARARHRGPARGRCVGDAGAAVGQHQRTDDHAREAGIGPDPGAEGIGVSTPG